MFNSSLRICTEIAFVIDIDIFFRFSTVRITVTNSVNRDTIIYKNSVTIYTIDSSKYKNLKLKKKEEKSS
jgi:hypothetical protein